VYPTHHAIVTAIALVPLRASGVSWGALAQFAAGSILLDADHYAAYAWRTGDLSVHRAYSFHRGRVKRDEARFALNLHVPRLLPGRNRPAHAVVVIAGIALVAALVPSLRPVLLGALFHRLQDYAWESARVGPGRDE
jgi:hypothetical protein